MLSKMSVAYAGTGIYAEINSGKNKMVPDSGLSADSVHKVFSSTFEPIPNRRGVHPFRNAPDERH